MTFPFAAAIERLVAETGESLSRIVGKVSQIDSVVADDPVRSAITEQVEIGVAVRMACLDVLTRRARGIEGWA